MDQDVVRGPGLDSLFLGDPEFSEGVDLVRSVASLGEHSRQRRHFLEYPQRDVTLFLMVIHGIHWHQTVVAKIESGERAVRTNEAFALAHIYDIDLRDLVRGEGLHNPPRWLFSTGPDGGFIEVIRRDLELGRSTKRRRSARRKR